MRSGEKVGQNQTWVSRAQSENWDGNQSANGGGKDAIPAAGAQAVWGDPAAQEEPGAVQGECLQTRLTDTVPVSADFI